VRISDEHGQQRQSAREGECGQNKAGESAGAAGLKKELGRVSERRGQSRRHARRRGSVTVVGKAELTRRAHGAEARACGRRQRALTRWARSTERERGARAREVGTDRLAPPSRGRGGARACGMSYC
jgi:hypothetical protein